MTTENHLNEVSRRHTGMIAKNRTSETTEQQHTEMAVNPTSMKTEKQRDLTVERKKGSIDEREIAHAAQEKAKEEEEKLSGLWEIRSRFKNLAETVLPKNPYLMGIPNEIHITTHEGPDWRRGTPFSPHEERVQYVSFQRLNDHETVLRPQSWDEENAKTSQTPSTRRTSSDFSSVPGHTPRRKMTMEEYMRRKKTGSASANASQEGSQAPHKAEAKIDQEAKTGLAITRKTSSSEAAAVNMGRQTMPGIAPGPKAPETASATKEVIAEKNGSLKSEGTSRKETITLKAPQKLSVMPNEGNTGKGIAREKEGVVEKVVQPTQEGVLLSKKRPIEAVISATGSDNSLGHHGVPASKKARVSSTASIPDEPSLPKQTNTHGFPPLLSPTLPSSIEAELANLQARANHSSDSKDDLGDTSDGRTTSSQKEQPKPEATSQSMPTKAPSASVSISVSSKQPGSNGPKSKIADAARDSMFFGQARRAQPIKKPETIAQPKQNAKKQEMTPKAEDDRVKITRPTDTEGQSKPNAKKPDLPAKSEASSRINEHPISKRMSKDVVSDPKGPVVTTPGQNPATEHREKKTLIVTLKIPRSKRKACQALLRFSPRPRKPNGLHAAPGPALTENNKEAQTNATEKQTQINQKASKHPAAAPVNPLKDDRGLAKPNSRGQKRPPGENEDPEPSKKRLKSSDDGDKKDGGESSSSNSRPRKVAAAPHDRVEKRSRPAEKDDLEPSKKRPKVSEDVNPVQPGLKASSNVLPSDSTPKLHTSNPKGEMKSVTMRRIASLDGEVKTPSAAVRGGTPNVPGSAERPGREGRPTSSTTSAALSEEAAQWRLEQQKYLELGKRLKHELDGIVKKDGVLMKDPTANKKGCPIGVESILCYMLGFTALDELQRTWGKPGSSTAWETLLPHIDYVKAITSSASHIYGLILQLEGICRNTIHSYDLERLEREPGAGASPEFISRLVENARLAQKAWHAGTVGLSINDLQKSFPKTWARRKNAPSVRNNGQEKQLVAGKFAASGYYLPLASTSTAVEAVKMGWSFLGEWAEKEGVEWKGRMF